MLKITIRETPEKLAIDLAGRVAGAWAAELGQAWIKAAPQLRSRAVSVDLRDVTYVDEEGKQILRQIETETGAAMIATTPWTRHLVAEICDKNPDA